MESELIELKRRLERAERQGRALFALLLLVAIGSLTVVARSSAPQMPGNSAKAPFKVLDDAGHVLVEIGTSFSGNGSITTWNTKGKAVTFLGHNQNGGVLQLFSDQGSSLIYVGSNSDGGEIDVAGNLARGNATAILAGHSYGAELEIRGPGGKAKLGLDTVDRNYKAAFVGPSLKLQSQVDGTYVAFGPHPDHRGQFRFVGNYSSTPAADPRLQAPNRAPGMKERS
jgi:hypothetical protein